MDSNEQYDRVIGVFGLRQSASAERNVFYSNVQFVESYLQKLDGWYDGRIKIISGGSKGVEIITETWALTNNVPFQRVKPSPLMMTANAFDIRNEQIIKLSTEILVFWDARDAFVARVLWECVRQGKECRLIPTDVDGK